MKRFALMLAVVLVAGVALAQTTNEVTSVNVVGITKYTFRSNSYNMVCVPFDAISTNDANLLGVFGTNSLRGSTFAANSDQIYMWDQTKQKYEIYSFKSTTRQFYLFTNFGGAAQNPALFPGDAFWVKTAGASTYATQGLSFSLMGEVVDVITQSTDIVLGYQMVGYPFSSDVRIDQLDFVNDGARKNAFAANADQISTWDGTKYQIYALKSDNLWHYYTNFGGAAASNTISLGLGFWYVSKTNFTWSETNKYSGNLR